MFHHRSSTIVTHSAQRQTQDTGSSTRAVASNFYVLPRPRLAALSGGTPGNAIKRPLSVDAKPVGACCKQIDKPVLQIMLLRLLIVSFDCVSSATKIQHCCRPSACLNATFSRTVRCRRHIVLVAGSKINANQHLTISP